VIVGLVNELHLSRSELLAPLFKFVLYLRLDFLLSLLEKAVVALVSLASLHIDALLMHSLVHVHEDLNLEGDLFGDVFLLTNVVASVDTEESALCAHSLLVHDTDQL